MEPLVREKGSEVMLSPVLHEESVKRNSVLVLNGRYHFGAGLRKCS